MFSYQSLLSIWNYIITVTLLSLVCLLTKPVNDFTNPDALSAIKRAKTSSCKQELKEFASKREILDYTLKLNRSCKLDEKHESRTQKVGCVTNSTLSLIKLDERGLNLTLCLDFCFSYGHSHGGFEETSKSCICGSSNHDHNEGLCQKSGAIEWYRVNIGIYYPKNLTHHYHKPQAQKRIRIAFLMILSGRSTIQTLRLLKNIYSEHHIYYLHTDGRDNYLFEDLSLHLDRYRNVILTQSRFNTIWGGPTLLKMILDAMQHLSRYDWDYYINLSESDFPIKPLHVLEDYLSRDTSLIYLKSHNIKGYNFIKKQGLNRNFYQCEDRAWLMDRRSLPSGIVYTGGSDWFALPRKFCNYILDNLYKKTGLVRPLTQVYNFTLLPAESFFHTLALNSEFCDKFFNNNLRLTNWNRKKGCNCQHKDVVDWCGCSPLIYRLSDLNKLKDTVTNENLFFTRKFDPTVSSSIISAIEQHLVQQTPVSDILAFDTRYWLNLYSNSSASRYEATMDDLVIEQYGHFALKQLKQKLNLGPMTSLHLMSVDLYFEHDTFIGMVFEYCDELRCLQYLVQKNSKAYLQVHDLNCFKTDDYILKVIEVNHNFDKSEKMFRNHRPIQHMSNIAVYHEWLTNQQDRVEQKNQSIGSLLFSWTSPLGLQELVQVVKLKNSDKPTKLSLAHRLNIPKPLAPGLWTLTISYDNIDCFSYRFLVFSDQAYNEAKIEQEQYDEFYEVSKVCSHEKNSTENYYFSCTNENWSLDAKTTIMFNNFRLV